MKTQAVHIVWFKRDLRTHDHAPLAEACRSGLVLPIYCWEPSVWGADDYAKQHQQFIAESLMDLKVALKRLGLSLLESQVGIVQTLSEIEKQVTIARLYSHEETGNMATYMVDKSVAEWCRYHRVEWQEFAQNGVVRRLKSRNHWNHTWEQRMMMPITALPQTIHSAPTMTLSKQVDLHVSGSDKPKRQRGGRRLALETLDSFIENRASKFRGGISSPLTAVTAGSRLSPYLAQGCLSMREVVQASRLQRAKLKEMATNAHGPITKGLYAGLIGFESRLHWHCHFMQKLESEPELEFENLHHAHDGMRDEHLADVESQKRLGVWARGETGWPMVDACMAMLRHTGWINFRMRAMLMSTASYLYWLHWRGSGLHLAREFLDYEPGIHWSQTQMQSGTTGINTLRIYSPIKQAQDYDPTGAFVRHWLPALRRVPDTWIFEPYLMPIAQQLQYGCVLEKDYPAPIVDISQAIKEARSKIFTARKKEGVYDETQAVIKKHASRKGMMGSQRDAQGNELKKIKRRSKKPTIPNQKELF